MVSIHGPLGYEPNTLTTAPLRFRIAARLRSIHANKRSAAARFAKNSATARLHRLRPSLYKRVTTWITPFSSMSEFLRTRLERKWDAIGGLSDVRAVLTWKRRLAEAQEKKECRDPGSNRGPSDLQSDALPTELSRPYEFDDL